MTDSVTPQSLNSCLIEDRHSCGMRMILIVDSVLLNSSESHVGSVPNTMKRLRCAAMRRVICGKSITKGGRGTGTSSRDSSELGRYESSQESSSRSYDGCFAT